MSAAFENCSLTSHLADIACFINQWQTLIAGICAGVITFAAAMLSVRMIKKQLDVTRDLHNQTIRREQNFTKIEMIPFTRSYLSKFRTTITISTSLIISLINDETLQKLHTNENYQHYIIKTDDYKISHFRKIASLHNDNEDFDFIRSTYKVMILTESTYVGIMTSGLVSIEFFCAHIIRAAICINMLRSIEAYCSKDDDQSIRNKATDIENDWKMVRDTISQIIHIHDPRGIVIDLVNEMIDKSIQHGATPRMIASQ